MISQDALIILILALAVATTLLAFGLVFMERATGQRLKRIEEKLSGLNAGSRQ